MTRRFVKSALRSVAARAYWASPRFLGHLTGKVLILAYHRVIPRTELATTVVQPGMYVAPDTFEQHLRFLTAHFELLSFHDLLARWEENAWRRATRYCVVTFDDGWLDNYVYAYPLLRAYRAPATIFLPTDLIGTSEWLWPDRLGYLLHRRRCRPDAVDSLIETAKTLSEGQREQLLRGLGKGLGAPAPDGRRLINWEEAREMSRNGIAFGSHTSRHVILTQISGTALQSELRRPLDVLRQQSVNHVGVLSYPNGGYSETVVAAARAAGYRAAVTMDRGIESTSRDRDLFRLKRIGVHDDVSRSIPLLAFHIARRARPMTASR